MKKFKIIGILLVVAVVLYGAYNYVQTGNIVPDFVKPKKDDKKDAVKEEEENSDVPMPPSSNDNAAPNQSGNPPV
jgi:hypothetical protein